MRSVGCVVFCRLPDGMWQLRFREAVVFNILFPLFMFIAGFFGGTIDQQARTSIANLVFNVFDLLLP